MTDASSRAWRVAAAAALLLVLSNGPVLRFVTGVLGRSAHWNDWAVWPFFAGAAAASAVLAWADWHRRGPVAGPTQRGLRLAPQKSAEQDLLWATLSRSGLLALCWYSAAAVASSLWSVYPGATLWRSLVYLGLALLALTLAGLSDGELAAVLALLTSTAVGVSSASSRVAASLAVIVLLYSEGIDHQGNWIGVYTNRNSLAPMAAMGTIAGLRYLLAAPATSWLLRPPPRVRTASSTLHGRPAPVATRVSVAALGSASWRRVGGAALVAASLVTMAGAGSRTAWSALVVALAVASGLGLAATSMASPRRRGSRRRWAAMVGGAVAMAAACAAAVAAAWNVPTFAQRRDIWSLVWKHVQERPWGGHGFFAFWEVPELVQEHVLLQRGSAHSSLVETALGLGLVGLLPLVVLAVLGAVNSGRSLWRRPSIDTWMWAAISMFVLVENLTESFVLWFSHIWVLLLAAALRRGTASVQPQRPHQPGTQAPRQGGEQVAGADVL